ncbi:MAG: hypothetical protein ACJAXQ_000754 [Parvibaculaceae bacterium]|jgi:hypothetical protein|tara:strand:+ start:164 stop:505 length:342 start_codon:yes stop_codon:yes gene_type:complete
MKTVMNTALEGLSRAAEHAERAASRITNTFQGAGHAGSGGQDSTPPNSALPAPAIPFSSKPTGISHLDALMLEQDSLPDAIVELKQAETAYKASAKLIHVADEMQDELLKALD